MKIKCAECLCAPLECKGESSSKCLNCRKAVCCCVGIHIEQRKEVSQSTLFQFLRYAKGLYGAALAIEILCIIAAEIGENAGLYLFGFNALGITLAYIMGYALAGFTTFVTILGRLNYSSKGMIIDTCCSVLEQTSSKGLIPNLKITFRSFALGIKRMPELHKQRNIKLIVKTSLYILITAESACILTAMTVDLLLYQYSLLLAVPLALLAGAFTVVAPEAYRRIKMQRQVRI